VTAFVSLAAGAFYLLLSGRMQDLISTLRTGLGLG
jgi:uncharacterized membrane protein YjjP (DUF1212 family)